MIYEGCRANLCAATPREMNFNRATFEAKRHWKKLTRCLLQMIHYACRRRKMAFPPPPFQSGYSVLVQIANWAVCAHSEKVSTSCRQWTRSAGYRDIMHECFLMRRFGRLQNYAWVEIVIVANAERTAPGRAADTRERERRATDIDSSELAGGCSRWAAANEWVSEWVNSCSSAVRAIKK